MNNENPNSDAPLRQVLKEWKVGAALPPRFRDQVWRRIARAETASLPSFSLAAMFEKWIATVLPRPALATAYLTLLLALGAGMGWSEARRETSRVSHELGVRYARTIDPYQATLEP